jgi:hypothetical protein
MRSKPVCRVSRGVNLGRINPPTRRGQTPFVTGSNRCLGGTSPIRGLSSSENWKKSAKTSGSLSWKDSASAIRIWGGSYNLYLHRGRLRRLFGSSPSASVLNSS